MPAHGIRPLNRRDFLLGLGAGAGTLVWPLAGIARASQPKTEPIRIGEINSYSRIPSFTIPLRNGWTLAMEQINATGGLLGGREVQIISRDDNGDPGQALTAAQELVTRHKVDALMGTFLSNVGLAVCDFALKRKILFVGSEVLTDAITWEKGNHYTFRLRPSTWMQATALAREAAKLPGTRWAIVAPNYEYGHSAVARFKSLLKELRPDVDFVAEQWPPVFNLDAGPTVQALSESRPDAIFNVLFASDLPKFVREGNTRGLFEGRAVVSMLTGEPEYLTMMGAEAPVGWIVNGYPWYDIDTPAHNAYVSAYQSRFGEPPMCGSLVGYNALVSLAAGIEKAGSTETEAMIAAMKGLVCQTPSGEITYRAADHQSTMGTWVGKTALKDGRGVMVDWAYIDGNDLLPPPDEVISWRPAGQ